MWDAIDEDESSQLLDALLDVFVRPWSRRVELRLVEDAVEGFRSPLLFIFTAICHLCPSSLVVEVEVAVERVVAHCFGRRTGM